MSWPIHARSIFSDRVPYVARMVEKRSGVFLSAYVLAYGSSETELGRSQSRRLARVIDWLPASVTGSALACLVSGVFLSG
jgi:hypothetical protein